MAPMTGIGPDDKQRGTAKVVGFLLLGLAFTMLIAAGVAPLPMPYRVMLVGLAAFGIFWAYRFMKLGRGEE